MFINIDLDICSGTGYGARVDNYLRGGTCLLEGFLWQDGCQSKVSLFDNFIFTFVINCVSGDTSPSFKCQLRKETFPA